MFIFLKIPLLILREYLNSHCLKRQTKPFQIITPKIVNNSPENTQYRHPSKEISKDKYSGMIRDMAIF
jgi:hypothetical protein